MNNGQAIATTVLGALLLTEQAHLSKPPHHGVTAHAPDSLDVQPHAHGDSNDPNVTRSLTGLAATMTVGTLAPESVITLA